MDKHCKGCAHHHNAKHPKNSPYAKRHNDWCCRYADAATKVLGRCKMHGGYTASTLMKGQHGWQVALKMAQEKK